MAKQSITKLELVCEKCGTQFLHLEIHKRMLYCHYCLEAVKRRERFLREESEWNRAPTPKNNDE